MNPRIELAKQALNNWNLSGDIVEVTKGYSGAWVFIVNTGKEKFILKRDTSKRKFLHKVLNFLEKNNFAYTSKVLTIPNSESTTYFDSEKYWDMLTFTPGKEINLPINLEKAHSIGEVIGKFHAILRDFPLDEDTKRDETLSEIVLKDRLGMWNTLSQENLNLLKEWDVYEIAEEYIELVKDIYHDYLDNIDLEFLEKKLPKVVVHRDLYPEHIYFEEDHVSGIIDFGGTRYSRRIDDIHRIIVEFSNYDTEIIKKIIDTYSTYSPLHYLEIEYMKHFILLGYVRGGFWMLEKALTDKDDLSGYPISLKQGLLDNIRGIKKAREVDFVRLLREK